MLIASFFLYMHASLFLTKLCSMKCKKPHLFSYFRYDKVNQVDAIGLRKNKLNIN